MVEAVTWEGDSERDKVARVNPMRQLPVLITPEGETVPESAAILIWLAEHHPEAVLAPKSGDASTPLPELTVSGPERFPLMGRCSNQGLRPLRP